MRLPVGGRRRLYEVTRIEDGRERRIGARAVDPGLHDALARPAPRARTAPPVIPGRPRVVVLDLPSSREDPPALQYIAACADPWPGPLAVWREGEGGGFELHGLIKRPAAIGALLDPLPPGPVGRWDRVNGARASLLGGTLASVTPAGALSGANTFALAKPNGSWEILAAAETPLVAERTYRLSSFVRGLEGSEEAAAAGAQPGALLVRLDGAIVPLVRGLGEIGLRRRYRIGPAGLDHADLRFVEIEVAASMLALKPFAPAHLTARRTAEGIRLGWVRRGRRDHDGWAVEIPLGEETERYEVDILSSSGAVLRTLAATAPGLLYPAALEAADFASARTSLRVAVAQLSAVAGRGFTRSALLSVS